MSVHLVGGGWQEDESAVYGPFYAEAADRADGEPTIAVVLWAETADEGAVWHEDYVDDLERIGPCTVRIVQLDATRQLDAADLVGADALFVGGGLTPGYHAAIMPAADAIRALVAGGMPYLGFSAGAMIAGDRALLGGWRIGGVAVSREDWSEGLDDVTIQAGLGLVDLLVDVHAAQAGTLSRAVAIVHAGLATQAVAIDESTALIASQGGLRVSGHGSVWAVTSGEPGPTVQVLAPTQPPQAH